MPRCCQACLLGRGKEQGLLLGWERYSHDLKGRQLIKDPGLQTGEDVSRYVPAGVGEQTDGCQGIPGPEEWRVGGLYGSSEVFLPPITHSRRSLGRPWKVSEVRQPIRLLERSLERDTHSTRRLHSGRRFACESPMCAPGACGGGRAGTQCHRGLEMPMYLIPANVPSRGQGLRNRGSGGVVTKRGSCSQDLGLCPGLRGGQGGWGQDRPLTIASAPPGPGRLQVAPC